ncbi:hypothetical protein K7X08_002987 [Anisodus acutangulus]|uniref:Cell wall hydroxyproline-rich glycoprotein n=1 Tax=Anisodus acutangulus TaxID=402998 RepID=A0A9Q1MCS7_9SOLA|nr:hypothetical protein K7X08_002987 [Anisodus acutangulus]
MRPPSRGDRSLFVSFLVVSFLSFQISSVAGQEGDNDIDLDDIKANASKLSFENPKLRDAYIALQSWKTAMFSDPFNFTANWTGPNVCSYGGVFCAPSLTDNATRVVAGIDLNHADIAGSLVPELGKLTDLAIFHLNSNRFCGVVPKTFSHFKLLRELDLSNNRFVGGFPKVVLSLHSLKFLDLRFNDFEGPVPNKLFDKDLDALFLNDNRFRFGIPENLGNSPVSVLVFANNDLGGCIPASIGKMGNTLNELILMNDNLTGCLPPQIGMLKKLTVFDVSFNKIQGPLPSTVGKMRSVEQLNVAHNKLTGVIPATICQLPRLQNFTYSFNYFTGEAPVCAATRSGRVVDGQENCIAGKKDQRSVKECASDDAKPYDCRKSSCFSRFATSPSTKPRPKPTPKPKRPPVHNKPPSPTPTPSRPTRPVVPIESPPPPSWKSSGSHNKRSPPPPPPPPPTYKKSPTYQHRSPPPPTHKISPVTHQSPPPPSPVYYHPSPPVYYAPPTLLVSKIQLFVVYPASPPPPSHASHSDASPGSRALVNPTAGTEISTSSNVSATGFSTANTGIVINPVLVLAATLTFLQRSEEACWLRVKDRQEEGRVRVTNSVT